MLSPLVKGAIDQISIAITRCMKGPEPLIVPGIALVYVTIDTLAHLEMRDGANHTIFEAWVERYLLPGLKDKPTVPGKLTKEDLWSARCGVLHEHSSRSNKTRCSKAVPVYYETRNGRESWIPWKMDRKTAHCLVIEDLLDALVDAVALFERTVADDRALEERVNTKGADMFAHSHNLWAVPSTASNRPER